MRNATPYAEALGPRVTPWLPSSVPGLTVWLESDYGVELNGGNVEAWRDRSGRGNHAGQSTAGARPIYAVVNGRPVLQTTKAARFITIANSADLDLHTTLGGSIYIVMSTSASGAGDYVAGRWVSGGPGTPNQSWIIGPNDGANTTPGVYVSEAGTLAQINRKGSPDASNGAVRVLRLRYSAASSLLYCQVDATRSAGAAIAAPTVGTQPTHIGRLFASDVTNGIDANVSAFLFYRRDLPDAEDVQVRDYLFRRHGAT